MLITLAAVHLVFIGTAVLTCVAAVVIGTAVLESIGSKSPVS